MPQGKVFGTLLFLVYVNDIWRNIDSSIRFFADDCIMYKKITIKTIEKICRRIWTEGVDGRKWDENKSR